MIDLFIESIIMIIKDIILVREQSLNVIKLRDDEPSGYYCLDGIFI